MPRSWSATAGRSGGPSGPRPNPLCALWQGMRRNGQFRPRTAAAAAGPTSAAVASQNWRFPAMSAASPAVPAWSSTTAPPPGTRCSPLTPHLASCDAGPGAAPSEAIGKGAAFDYVREPVRKPAPSSTSSSTPSSGRGSPSAGSESHVKGSREEPGRRRTPDVAAAREGQTMRVTEATMRLPECSGLRERPFRPVPRTPSEGGGSPRPTGAPAEQVISPSP